jgi:hypothetical protein
MKTTRDGVIEGGEKRENGLGHEEVANLKTVDRVKCYAQTDNVFSTELRSNTG